MTDLDAAIRAKLNSERLDGFESRPCLSVEGCDVNGFDEMRAALLAVLDLHKRSNNRRLQGCTECSATEVDRDWTVVPYPCPTVRTITEALGIEPA